MTTRSETDAKAARPDPKARQRRTRGGITFVAVVVGLIGVMLAIQYFTNFRTVSLQLNPDPGITSFELYKVQDEAHALLSYNPSENGAAREIVLRVKVEPTSLIDRAVVQYYFFIVEINGQKYRSDSFIIEDHGDKPKMVIGSAGHWEITGR